MTASLSELRAARRRRLGLRKGVTLRGTHVVFAFASSIVACSSVNSLEPSATSSSSARTGSTSTSTSSATSTDTGSTSSSSNSFATSSSASSSSSSTIDACALPPVMADGGTPICSNATGNVGATGYSYELWSNGTGTGCMTVFDIGATFSAHWSAAGDFLSRVGLGFDSTKTPDQIGTLAADFAETKTGTASFSDIGVYGWTVNPLHEYYIVDDWFGGRPTSGTHVGTISVDGGVYDVYTHTQTNQPSIQGTATFVQYFSVRQQARSCGHISISTHFAQWEAMGLQMGSLEEARLLMEAGGNATGNIEFTTASITLN